MIPIITIHDQHNTVSVKADKNLNLLQIIRENGFDIYAPCGGNGTCGKCRVRIKGEGSVTSCVYYPEKDIDVFLPDRKESQILTTQYDYSTQVPVYPGDAIMKVSYPLGVAIDIGTSTIVFYLVNLITGSIVQTKGVINPQVKYGADVITRIQYCAEPDGLNQLQSEIISTINEELKEFADKTGVGTDQVIKISVAGNTIMLHLLLGVDPTSIALAPFTPTFTDSKVLLAGEIGIIANEETEVHLLPSISGYVGADIVAGLASISPPKNIKNYLFVDIGTNGEMALVTSEKILCCATAAGPAFEGANISCGMGAFAGAVSVFKNRSDYQTIADGAPTGICGSGLIDIIAYLVSNNLVSSDGILEKEFKVFVANSGEKHISVNQQDIREVQLAKAAIIAGINILVKTANLEFKDIDALFLAGGFGNYINIENAVSIGLLPDGLLNKIIPIGNTSGTGTTLALKSQLFEKNINEIVEKAEIIELSTHDDFVLEYAMNMNF